MLNVSSKLRSCIEDQNSRHAEDVKEAKFKVAEAVDKVTASKVLRSLYLDVFCYYILFVILYASYL